MGKNFEILPPPNATCALRTPAEIEVLLTKTDGFQMSLTIYGDGAVISDVETRSPEGASNRISGLFVLTDGGQLELQEALGAVLSDGPPASGK
ncbi:MAG: hypothetical protein FD180_320 [Planctomycetota bacterium]|nr:MAG: hypothetical protein FD180_320 [Planctomycetota bacterium]